MSQDFDPPKWGRIWACLSSAQRTALREVCWDIDIPYERWYTIPALALTYQTSVVVSVLRKIGSPGRSSFNAAGEKACAELGLNWVTVRRRINKWRETAR